MKPSTTIKSPAAGSSSDKKKSNTGVGITIQQRTPFKVPHFVDNKKQPSNSEESKTSVLTSIQTSPFANITTTKFVRHDKHSPSTSATSTKTPMKQMQNRTVLSTTTNSVRRTSHSSSISSSNTTAATTTPNLLKNTNNNNNAESLSQKKDQSSSKSVSFLKENPLVSEFTTFPSLSSSYSEQDLLDAHHRLSETLLLLHSTFITKVFPEKLLIFRQQSSLMFRGILSSLLNSWMRDLTNDRTASTRIVREYSRRIIESERYFRNEEEGFLGCFSMSLQHDDENSHRDDTHSSSASKSSARSRSDSPAPRNPKSYDDDDDEFSSSSSSSTSSIFSSPEETEESIHDEFTASHTLTTTTTSSSDVSRSLFSSTQSTCISSSSSASNSTQENEVQLPRNFLISWFKFLELILPACCVSFTSLNLVPTSSRNSSSDNKENDSSFSDTDHHHQQHYILQTNKTMAVTLAHSFLNKFYSSSSSSSSSSSFDLIKQNPIFAAFVSRQLFKVVISSSRINNTFDDDNSTQIHDDESLFTILYWNNGFTKKSVHHHHHKLTTSSSLDKDASCNNDRDASCNNQVRHHCCSLNCDRNWLNPISRPLSKAARHFKGRLFDDDDDDDDNTENDEKPITTKTKYRPWVIVVAEAGSKELVSFICHRLGYTLIGEVQSTGRSLPKSRQDVAVFVRNDKVQFIDYDSVDDGMKEVLVTATAGKTEEGKDDNNNNNDNSSCTDNNNNQKSKMLNGRWTCLDFVFPISRKTVGVFDTNRRNSNQQDVKRIRIGGVHLHQTGKKSDKDDYQHLYSSKLSSESSSNVDHVVVVGDFNRNIRRWLNVKNENDQQHLSVVQAYFGEDANDPIDNILVLEKDYKRKNFSSSNLIVVEEKTNCMEPSSNSAGCGHRAYSIGMKF